MKKSLSILCVILLLACMLAGCNRANDAGKSPTSAQPAQNTGTDAANGNGQANEGSDTQTQPEGNPEGSEGDKILVIYYSATGYTKAVAETIAETTGGELFELVPTEIYSDDDLNWRDKNSRVSREHDNESLRAVELVTETVENWDEYDTVYIGYPIWWGIAAWPVDSFIKANDFTGKTVIPFCTSTSSGLGESGELLAEMAGTGTWLEGERFRSSVSAEDVVEWVESLNS